MGIQMRTVFIAILIYLQILINAEIIYEERADANDEWWKHATFYQIYPRSFKDSDGDGMGDLKGITSKLDHLVNAGITATWLSPIFESPGVDAGYDISDYRAINEVFGTLNDFKELTNRAEELGIKIILDFVPNHTSNEHEWFINSAANVTGYEDFYVWLNGHNSSSPPNNWISQFKYSAWEYSENRTQWYYHQFAPAQPDLNYRNPNVVREMKDILVYWMERGVSGFRIDAVPYLFEDETFRDEPLADDYINHSPNETQYLSHVYTTDQPQTFDMIYQWRDVVDNFTNVRGGDARVIMTEAYTNIDNTMLYYGNSTKNGAHFTFNFFLLNNIRSSSTANDTVSVIKQWFEKMPSRFVANWVLGNHDNHRAATRLGVENVDGYNMLTTLLPGVAVTYNGEEIGMEDGEVTWEEGDDPSACNGSPGDFSSTSRDFERTPFHWDYSKNAGFSTANRTWLPVSSKYVTNNLLAQSSFGEKSHFHVYQALMKLRKESTFIYGNLNIEVLDRNVIAYTRELRGNDTYVFLFNNGNSTSTVSLSYFTSLGRFIRVVLSSVNSSKNEGDVLPTDESIVLNAHEAIVGKAENYSTSSGYTLSWSLHGIVVYLFLSRVL